MSETPINFWETLEPRGPEFLANYLSELRGLVLRKKYKSKKILAARAEKEPEGQKNLPEEQQLLLQGVNQTFKNQATPDEIININRSIEELGEIMTEAGILQWAKDNAVTLDEKDLEMARDLTQIYLDHKND